MNPVIIDVREKDEYDAEHIEHSIHIPLSTFGQCAPAILKSLDGKKVVLMCRSGKRASMAANQAMPHSSNLTLEVFPGGILEWKSQGKPTVAARQFHLPIMRQVQLIAGALVLTGAVLATFVNPSFLFLSGFIGAGLMFAGATGFCGMAVLLAKAPWNRTYPKVREELCQASPSSKDCPK